MRTNTKIKLLLVEHTLSLSLNEEGGIDMIVTNNETGDAHLCQGASLSAAAARAYSDTMRMKKLEGKKGRFG